MSGQPGTGRHEPDQAARRAVLTREKQHRTAAPGSPRQGFDPTPKAGVAGSNPAGGTTKVQVGTLKVFRGASLEGLQVRNGNALGALKCTIFTLRNSHFGHSLTIWQPIRVLAAGDAAHLGEFRPGTSRYDGVSVQTRDRRFPDPAPNGAVAMAESLPRHGGGTVPESHRVPRPAVACRPDTSQNNARPRQAPAVR